MEDLRKEMAVTNITFLLVRESILTLFLMVIFLGCKKEVKYVNEEVVLYPEADRSITITDDIKIDNGVVIRNPVFNYITYDDFLRYISTSDHFQIVSLKDFKNTTSKDKVILSLRHDIDNSINAAIKFAYREHKYGIKSTYFVLHTANYYGEKNGPYFKRNNNIIYYFKKIQDAFGHEIGFHNDLVTLQIVYGIPPKEYLKNELAYLRGNNIHIQGTSYHGSQYCYIYKYFNAYFWKEYPNNGWNYEFIPKDYKIMKIEKDSLSSYNLSYEAGLLDQDYYFTDSNFIKGKRWNMRMVNLDTIKPGKKVIILLHPANWD